ncbi:type VI secretion system contractile sheath small subunit (plasmid) [Leisingera aquaemixtae]|nr:type VI secretion system contractile sheath small subunit [Leisingera aquaemixtae]
MADSSQKFIARNRAPRVQIEYDVELYGAEKKVQLPFVMGVMSDLLGKSKVEQPAIADRKFLEIDADNFDERMKGLAPRAAFTVPNTLTGDGNLSVDLTFESLADFSPGAIAAKVDALRPLLEARTQLQNLMAYMDGKTGAEVLIETILNDPSLLAAVSAPAADAQSAAALDSLRTLELPEAQADTTGDVLAGLAAQAPEDAEAEDAASGVLAGLRAAAPEEPEADDGAADVLAGLSAAAPEDEDQGDEAGEALASLAAAGVPDAGESDQTGAVLEDLAQAEMPDAEEDTSGAVLAGLAAQEPEETAGEDAAGAALESLAAVEIAETAAEDASGVLDALADLDVPEAAVEEDHSAVLQGLAPAEVEDEAEDAAGAALESLAAVEVSEDAEEEVSGVLSGLADLEQAEEDSGAQAASALESLADAAVPNSEEEDGLEDVLGSLLEDAAEEEDAASETEDALESLAAAGIEDADDGEAEDILEGLLDAAPDDAPEEDDLSAVLDSLEAPEETEEADAAGDVLAGLADDLPEGDPEDETDLDDILGGLDAPDEETSEDGLTAALDTLEAPDDEEGEDSGLDDLLADLGSGVLEDEAEEDTADVLAELAGADEAEDTDSGDADLDALLSGGLDEDDDLDSLLGGLGAEEDTESDPDTLLGDAADEAVAEDAAEDSGLDDLLSGLDAGEEEDSADLDALLADDEAAEEDGGDDLDALLGGLDETVEDAGEDAGDSGLDDLLGGLDDDGGEKSGDADGDDLDELLGGLDEDEAGEDASLDDLLGGLGSDEDGDGDLDSLLAGLGGEADAEEADGAESAEDDLDALLGGLGDADADLDSLMGDDGDVDLDDLLGGLGDDDEDPAGDGSDDLDALLGDLDDGGNAPAAETAGAELSDEPEFAYGTMSAERPAAQKLARKRFRMAVLGDFSGRAAKGQLETGDALAARKAILLDPDTVEDVIGRFATELVLPIGKEGAGIAVKLEDLDGLHPDELYENVELFSELAGLRKQLQSGATADHAAKTLKAWAEKYGTKARAPKRTSAGNAVPADKRLSAFQQLIKDTGITPRPATPVEDLLARVVGPHIRALPDPDLAAMQKAVDEALSDAMRLVLHHPEFQSVEAQWRSLDLMARSIEADDTLDVVLYDISAEELAADLAAEDDLSRTGLVRLLTEEPLDEENGRGGYSALIGMYQFEETPPHAELLGRIARVAAHVDAPFFASISPEFLKTPKAERPKLVAEAWDTLQGMAEAGHLGLVSPRFLLRRPYGEKTEPCYEFEFEEFTETEGLKGMLWANPVVLVAILLGRSFKEFGPSLQLGKIMSLGGMPYHYVSDRFGDQVALPCTERNIDLNKIAMAQERGFMAVSAVKGRDEVRLTSFNSLKGSQILGPWTGLPAPEPSPPDPRGRPEPPVPAGGGDEEDLDLGSDDGGDFGLDDLDLGEDDDGLDLSGLDFDAEDGGLDDLDDLLSSFGDDSDEDDDDGGEEMDAELAALLDDL